MAKHVRTHKHTHRHTCSQSHFHYANAIEKESVPLRLAHKVGRTSYKFKGQSGRMEFNVQSEVSLSVMKSKRQQQQHLAAKNQL